MMSWFLVDCQVESQVSRAIKKNVAFQLYTYMYSYGLTHSDVVQLGMPLPPTALQTPLPEHLPPLAEPVITWNL